MSKSWLVDFSARFTILELTNQGSIQNGIFGAVKQIEKRSKYDTGGFS